MTKTAKALSRAHRRAAALLTGLALTLCVPVQAKDLPGTAYAETNAALVAGYALPRVERFVTETTALRRTMDGYCATRQNAPLAPARAHFHAAMNAWMAIQHLRFGPMELFMRAHRIQFAPDPQGRVEQALKELLAAGDGSPLSPDSFGQGSVAVQGFPALEILLFGDGAAARLSAPGTGGDFRCDLAQAIAFNLQDMAKGMHADWTGDAATPFVRLIAEPGPDNPYYPTHRDASLEFFKSLYGGLQAIVDVKLGPVVGTSLAEARPDLAESALSARSMSNMVAMLESLKALYMGPDGQNGLHALLLQSGEDEKLAALLPRAFDITTATARNISAPLPRIVVDPDRRAEAEKLQLQARALKQLVSSRLAPAIGLAVGFNALDGD